MSGEILSILAVLSFSASNAMFRKVENKVSAPQINATRTTIGAITFIIFAFILGKINLISSLSIEIVFLLFLSIFLGQVIGDTAYFYLQEIIGTTIALTLSLTFPFFTIMISLALGNSVPSLFLFSALFIGIGVLLISIAQNESDNKVLLDNKLNFSNIVLVLTLGLIVSLSWALGITILEFTLNDITDIIGSDEYSSLLGNVVRFSFAGIVLIIAAMNRPKLPVKEWDGNTWKWLLAASILGTSLGAFFYTEATRVAGAALMSIIATANPLFAMPITWLLNGERINKKSLLGVIITMVGVVILFL